MNQYLTFSAKRCEPTNSYKLAKNTSIKKGTAGTTDLAFWICKIYTKASGKKPMKIVVNKNTMLQRKKNLFKNRLFLLKISKWS